MIACLNESLQIYENTEICVKLMGVEVCTFSIFGSPKRRFQRITLRLCLYALCSGTSTWEAEGGGYVS